MKKLYIDIGGTHLRSELHSGSSVVCEQVASQDQELLAYIDRKMSEHPDIGFIGIAYAGQVDSGMILSSPNIAFSEAAIKKSVESRYGVTLAIDNDLNCAAMAEAAHWRSRSIALLYVGTGIGAAMVDDGKIVRGSRNLAYEIGHIPYRDAPFLCGCGRRNCVELFASGSGMAKWLHHFGIDRSPDLHRFRDSKVAHERTVAGQFEEALLHAAGTLVTLANPSLLILGGGVIRKNPYLLALLEKELGAFALKPSLETLRIEMSALENAPMAGARLLEAYG